MKEIEWNTNKLKVMNIVNVQIKSVAKPYPWQRLVFSLMLRPLYPPRENPLPKA